jgi:hypothetical protein
MLKAKKIFACICVYFIFTMLFNYFSLYAQSQNNYSRANRTITFLGGVSFPTGDFSSASVKNAGYGESGVSLGLEFNSAITNEWSVGVSGLLHYNGYDRAARQEAMRDSLTKYTIHITDYIFTSILGHVGYRIPLTSDFDLYGKVQLGGLIIFQPEVREDNITRSGSGRRTSSAVVDFAFGEGICAGVNFQKRWDLSIRYLVSNPSYDVSVHEAHGTTQTAAYTKQIDRSISVIQIMLGYVIGL